MPIILPCLGLIMGTNAQTWNNLAGGGGRMKLSQLIDMYFAERGVLNTNVRACQRVVQFNAMFTPDQIMQQVSVLVQVYVDGKTTF